MMMTQGTENSAAIISLIQVCECQLSFCLIFLFQRLVYSISHSAGGRDCIPVTFSRCRSNSKRHHEDNVLSWCKAECV